MGFLVSVGLGLEFGWFSDVFTNISEVVSEKRVKYANHGIEHVPIRPAVLHPDCPLAAKVLMHMLMILAVGFVSLVHNVADLCDWAAHGVLVSWY
jgi:hypothetical protein